MTKSLDTFYNAIKEAEELLACYDNLNGSDASSPPEVLKKASLILTLTAWETYIEDVSKELFINKFGALSGSLCGRFMEKQLTERLKQFHNPDSRKTKHLFEEFFSVDITESWDWNNVSPKDARTQLNKWISMRGDAVHRSQTNDNKPYIIRREELTKCLRFFQELVKATDNALDNI